MIIISIIPDGVVTIWERPSAKHIVSIGDNLIKDDAEEYSIAATIYLSIYIWHNPQQRLHGKQYK